MAINEMFESDLYVATIVLSETGEIAGKGLASVIMSTGSRCHSYDRKFSAQLMLLEVACKITLSNHFGYSKLSIGYE
jgi:hypothetical protein